MLGKCTLKTVRVEPISEWILQNGEKGQNRDFRSFCSLKLLWMFLTKTGCFCNVYELLDSSFKAEGTPTLSETTPFRTKQHQTSLAQQNLEIFTFCWLSGVLLCTPRFGLILLFLFAQNWSFCVETFTVHFWNYLKEVQSTKNTLFGTNFQVCPFSPFCKIHSSTRTVLRVHSLRSGKIQLQNGNEMATLEKSSIFNRFGQTAPLFRVTQRLQTRFWQLENETRPTITFYHSLEPDEHTLPLSQFPKPFSHQNWVWSEIVVFRPQ